MCSLRQKVRTKGQQTNLKVDCSLSPPTRSSSGIPAAAAASHSNVSIALSQSTMASTDAASHNAQLPPGLCTVSDLSDAVSLVGEGHSRLIVYACVEGCACSGVGVTSNVAGKGSPSLVVALYPCFPSEQG